MHRRSDMLINEWNGKHIDDAQTATQMDVGRTEPTKSIGLYAGRGCAVRGHVVRAAKVLECEHRGLNRAW